MNKEIESIPAYPKWEINIFFGHDGITATNFHEEGTGASSFNQSMGKCMSQVKGIETVIKGAGE